MAVMALLFPLGELHAPYAVPVQATVRHYSRDTRSGEVLFDDGTRLAFDSDAFDRSGLRLLRLGQRVRIIVAGEEAQ